MSTERERITISIKKHILEKIDQNVDGVKMRNRSHAIEMLVSQSLNMGKIDDAVIMAGGKGAIRLVPIIEDSIAILEQYGVSNIYIAVGFLGDKIKQNLNYNKKHNLNLSFIEGGEGTAGALNPLRKILKKSFIVINLDEKNSFDLKHIIEFHNQHLPVTTVATNDQKSLKGIYIIEPDIFSYINSGFSMLEDDVFPKLAKDNRVLFFPLFG